MPRNRYAPRMPLDIIARRTSSANPSGVQPAFAPLAPPTSRDEATTVGGFPLSVQRFPPDYFPIPGATEIFAYAEHDSVGAEAGTLLNLPAPGSVLQLPPRHVGVIRTVAININDLTAADDLSFSLRINGTPVAGFGNLRVFPRAATSIERAWDTRILIPDGGTVDITFTNGNGGLHLVGATYTGWFWPEEAGRRWIGEDA